MSLASQIAKAIGMPVSLVIGVVSDVSALPQLTVTIRGVDIDQLSALASYVTAPPAVGDNVAMITYGSTFLVLGAVEA